MADYADNMYNWLKNKGLAAKYEFAGIYCIKIDQKIVYIGKSGNMLRRISQHYVGIQKETEKKYCVLAEARRRGHDINFDVLYYAQSRTYADKLAEIGSKEGEYIRKYNPVLNAQIPKKDKWKQFDVREVEINEILKQF